MTKAKSCSVIRFQANVHQIKTLVDGGMNVTLALSEKDIDPISKLLECKQRGAILEVAIVPREQKIENAKKETDTKSSSQRRKQRYPYRA